MELLAELLKICIPALAVLYGMFLIVQSFLTKQIEEQKLSITKQIKEQTLPLQLQAFERLILFLERISPNQLLIRVQPQSIQVADFLPLLLAEIREEYNHNLAQQLYISHENWVKLTGAKDSMVAVIQQAANEIPRDAPAIELSKKVMEKTVEYEFQATSEAIIALKTEARQLFV